MRLLPLIPGAAEGPKPASERKEDLHFESPGFGLHPLPGMDNIRGNSDLRLISHCSSIPQVASPGAPVSPKVSISLGLVAIAGIDQKFYSDADTFAPPTRQATAAGGSINFQRCGRADS